ncbi:MAG: flavodoxin family protein [Candidatus Latescibacteria bacterium]|nr:flavodoxin family protein [Candidatus Latescibacterota bacterium]
MIRILGLIGSPRKGKNTDQLVQAVLTGAEDAGAKVTKIYLNDLKIKPCQACQKHPYPKYCIYNDGMNKLYKLFEQVDGIVLGTPAYYETISSQAKLMIDRCNCLSLIKRDRQGKPKFIRRINKPKLGVFVWVSDCSRDIKPALASIRFWCQDINLNMVKTIKMFHSDRKDNNKQELIKQAYQSGIALVKKIRTDQNTN